MMWQDPAQALLLVVALVGTWRMALDRATRVDARAALAKAASSLGFVIINISLGLYISSIVSLAFVVAFVMMACTRNTRPAVVPA